MQGGTVCYSYVILAFSVGYISSYGSDGAAFYGASPFTLRMKRHADHRRGALSLPKDVPQIKDPYDVELKKSLHPKADEKNYVGLKMGVPNLLCGARRKGNLCKQVAGMGTKHLGYGRCKFHGGNATGPKTPEGKARVGYNKIHGLYSRVLDNTEKVIFDELKQQKAEGLEYEIYLLKTKILSYLDRWRVSWQHHYDRKLQEECIEYKCKACGKEYTRSALSDSKGCYTPECSKGELEEVGRSVAVNTHEIAEDYANRKTKIFYSESENGSRSYYRAGTIEDRALDRAMNTLGRLVEKHARLTEGNNDDMLQQLNAELRAASHGNVSVSWGTKPQAAEGGGADGT